jgi:1-deoxy-D-xylulose-5-phosphate reductoisomerase
MRLGRISITLLGATGSVGRSTAAVLLAFPERFRIEAVVGGTRADALAETARSLGARFAAIANPASGPALKDALAGSGIASGAGPGAVAEAVAREADFVVAAITGAAGLAPTYAALRAGRRIALANKECLVCAGEAFMAEARRVGAIVLPIDSEHNAIKQALGDGDLADVTTMTLTASGGPFRTWSAERIASATVTEALTHPTWSMGAKITIDSASLMNKGLELIEAHHLFGIESERLDVLVHPQSIVHGLVHWRDGAVTAGMAAPDMRVPIADCLAHGAADGLRLAIETARLDLARARELTFEAPDEARFPCLRLARAALADGGGASTILNAANEIAVEAFIAGRMTFADIPALVEETCEKLGRRGAPGSVAEALAIDDEARRFASAALDRLTNRTI